MNQKTDGSNEKGLLMEANKVITGGAKDKNPLDLIHLLVAGRGMLAPRTYTYLFNEVSRRILKMWECELPRRLLVRLPVHSESVSRNVKDLVKSFIMKKHLPEVLKRYLVDCVMVLPYKGKKLVDVLKQGAPLRCAGRVAQIIAKEDTITPIIMNGQKVGFLGNLQKNQCEKIK